MARDPGFRRPMGARDAAEAAFKTATTKPVDGPPKAPVPLPGLREQVTLRIDQDVLEHFRAMGAGWQDKINEVLKRAAGK